MSSKFKKELISGIIYSGIGKYTSLFLSLLVTAILARILTPNDFGIIAIATVIITFFNMISEIGIAPAIIQYKELSSNDISNIFSLTVYIGIICSIVFFLISPYIATFYHSEILVNILQYLSVSLLFATLNIVPNALFYRDKKFKFISIRTFFIQLIVGIISVISALLGLGVYSLLIPPILSNIILFIVSYVYYPQVFTFYISKEPIKKIFSFSSYQFLFNIINYLTRNLDKLLIGKFIDMTSLGYYEKSYRLMMLPLSNISSVINPVLHPLLSDFQKSKNEMEIQYSKIVRLLGFIGIFITTVCFWGAKEIILITFGEQWIDAVYVFKILSLSIIFQLIMSPCGAIYQATDSTKEMFRFGVFSIFTTILGFIIAIIFWKTAVAIAYSFIISIFINFIIGYNILYNKVFKRDYSLFILSLKHIWYLFALLFISLKVIKYLIPIENIYISFITIVSFTFLLEVSYMHFFKIYDLKLLLRTINHH